MTYLMYLSHTTSISCTHLLVVESTSAIHLGKRYSKKLYLLQQKYLQFIAFALLRITYFFGTSGSQKKTKDKSILTSIFLAEHERCYFSKVFKVKLSDI